MSVSAIKETTDDEVDDEEAAGDDVVNSVIDLTKMASVMSEMGFQVPEQTLRSVAGECLMLPPKKSSKLSGTEVVVRERGDCTLASALTQETATVVTAAGTGNASSGAGRQSTIAAPPQGQNDVSGSSDAQKKPAACQKKGRDVSHLMESDGDDDDSDDEVEVAAGVAGFDPTDINSPTTKAVEAALTNGADADLAARVRIVQQKMAACAAKKKAEDAASAKKKAEDDAAAKKKKAEYDAAAKKKAEDNTAAKKKKAEDDAAAKKKKAEDDAAAKKKKAKDAAAAKKKAKDAAAANEKENLAKKKQQALERRKATLEKKKAKKIAKEMEDESLLVCIACAALLSF